MSGHLTVENIFTAYDRAVVLSGISIEVMPGKITCILGSNGAGKSTLIRSILRLTPPRSGTISLDGQKLDQMATHDIIALGIACIPEGRRIFAKMTVEENLRVGAYLVKSEKTVRSRLDKVYEIFPRLKERAKQLAGTMSGGEQAMVSIGRGMMTDPKLLIIDEPSLGLSPLFVQENFNVVRDLNRAGITVLLVEQNVNQTLAISHYGYVLSQGRIIVHGDSSSLAQSEEVHSAYFGGAH
jgi:branched-chain amino acid transport system ATP-binding protein